MPEEVHGELAHHGRVTDHVTEPRRGRGYPKPDHSKVISLVVEPKQILQDPQKPHGYLLGSAYVFGKKYDGPLSEFLKGLGCIAVSLFAVKIHYRSTTRVTDAAASIDLRIRIFINVRIHNRDKNESGFIIIK